MEPTSVKWLKICVLVLLTLAAMRATSWAVAWALARLGAANVRLVAVLANVAGFAGFLFLLHWNMLPGEPVDWAAIVFGLLAFTIYALVDLSWTPWRHRLSSQADAHR